MPGMAPWSPVALPPRFVAARRTRLVGRRYELGMTEVSIGRGDNCTICVNTDQVSRKHATVQHILGKYYLVDMRSTNGTFVNEQKLVAPAMLTPGDTIRVGTTSVELRR